MSCRKTVAIESTSRFEERAGLGVKAIEGILPVREAQLLTYLRLPGLRVGLLIISLNVPVLKEGIRRRVL